MSGACYAGDLLGKPAGAPGLAEYFYENEDGVCVKQASYVPSPYPACRDIDALARFSRRATRERPLPAAVEAVVDAIVCKSNPRPTPRKPPGFPRRAADRPSPHRAASSAASPSSPSPPVTVSCSASASSSPSSPPPWYVQSPADPQLSEGAAERFFASPTTIPRIRNSGVRVVNASVFSRTPRTSTRQRETIETVNCP